MTDKFRLLHDVVVDTSNGKILYANDCCNKLNHLERVNEKLKNENNMLKITIGRNEAYIDRLTHTSEWKTSAQDNKDYHTVLKEWEEEMIDKYSDKRKVTLRRYE